MPPASIGTSDLYSPACIGDPACIETLSTCHIKPFCVYMVYLISNTNHNKQLGLRFILSTQYAYWAYLCHNWHQVDPSLYWRSDV